ncbi:uncharacterized protein LOC142337311 isoform X2 [Convolutriloba macropyga]|uniref:uncharacterized protein LOC142337311 isoform X2 n=1 Tax=Convolutriloba macropyga TaxID=536237 RepID=UPI003F51DEB8
MLSSHVKINLHFLLNDIEGLDVNNQLSYQLYKQGYDGSLTVPEGVLTLESILGDIVAAPQRKRSPNFGNSISDAKIRKTVKASTSKAVQDYSKPQNQPIVSTGSMGAATFGRDLSGNYICPFPACGKWFPNPRNAQRHFDSTHSGIEYNCQVCSASFGRKDSLKRHAMNTHKLNEKMAQAMLS